MNELEKPYRYVLDLQLFAEDDNDEDEDDDDDDQQPPKTNKKKTPPKEGDTPAWASQLLTGMNNLSKALGQEGSSKAKAPQDVKVPPIKQPEQQQQEEQQEQPQESQSSQAKDNKSFLRWFLG